jgi:transposase
MGPSGAALGASCRTCSWTPATTTGREGQGLGREIVRAVGCARAPPEQRWVWVPEGQVEPPTLWPGFTVLPRRWVVERTFSWIEQNRTMSKALRDANGHERRIRLGGGY